MCWNHLICCFHGEKCKNKTIKQKKKHNTQKILLPHIFTTGAPQDIIQPDLGSCSTGLQLSFFWPFFLPSDLLDGPWQSQSFLSCLFFPFFHQIRCNFLFGVGPETAKFPFLDIYFLACSYQFKLVLIIAHLWHAAFKRLWTAELFTTRGARSTYDKVQAVTSKWWHFSSI